MIEYKNRAFPKYVWQFLNKNMAKLAAALNPYIGAPTSSYKVYSALISQSSTSAPTAIILENTLGVEPVWSYGSIGYYCLTATGAFPGNKTAIITGPPFPGGIPIISAYNSLNYPDSVCIAVNDPAGNPINDGLNNTFIEIRVYN